MAERLGSKSITTRNLNSVLKLRRTLPTVDPPGQHYTTLIPPKAGVQSLRFTTILPGWVCGRGSRDLGPLAGSPPEMKETDGQGCVVAKEPLPRQGSPADAERTCSLREDAVEALLAPIPFNNDILGSGCCVCRWK